MQRYEDLDTSPTSFVWNCNLPIHLVWDICLLPSIQIGSGAHPASLSRGHFRGEKRVCLAGGLKCWTCAKKVITLNSSWIKISFHLQIKNIKFSMCLNKCYDMKMYGVWRCSSTHSQLWHYVEVSGQFQATTDFLPKNSRYSLGRRMGGSQGQSGRRGDKKNLEPC